MTLQRIPRLLAALLCFVFLILAAAGCANPGAPSGKTTDDGTKEPTAEEADMLKIHVDPVNGSDENDGTAAAPLKTVSAAKNAVRAASADRDVTVVLAGGTYYLPETLAFTPEDGGRNGSTVTYEGAEGQTAILSGGAPLSGWTLADEAKNIWVCDAKTALSAFKDGFAPRDLRVNGVRATIARTAENLFTAAFDDKTLTTDLKIASGLKNPSDVCLVLRNMWTESRVRVSSASSSGGKTTFTMVQPAWKNYNVTAGLGGAAISANQFAFLENAYEFLDLPGEWYADTAEGKVYYIPRSGEDMAKAEAVLGCLEEVVTVKGTKKEPVTGLSFRNLTFSDSTWLQAETDEGLLTIQGNVYKAASMTADTTFDNSKWLMPKAAVYGEYLKNVTFTGCRFTCLGGTGLWLSEGVKSCSVTKNSFTDLAGSGIMLGSFTTEFHDCVKKDGSNLSATEYRLTENNKITDNRVKNVGTGYSSACGIMVGYVKNADISYNTISDLPYTGISYGWGWGCNGQEMRGAYYEDEDGEFLFGGSTISHNHIENIMNVLFDGGGIYTLGRNDGTDISGNYIVSVNNDYGGIYLDNGSQGFTVADNVLVSCHRNYIYKGDFNEICGNYAKKAVAPDMPMYEPLDAAHPQYTFRDNYLSDEAAEEEILLAAGARG